MFLHRRELHVLNNQRSGRDRERAMRAKACFVMAVALLWSASVFAEFPMGSFETGNDLIGVCSDHQHFDQGYFNQGYCEGYLVGVADVLNAVKAMKANGYEVPSACI